MRRIAYRLRYYWRCLCHALGFCPACYSRVNFTRSGRAICPNCKQR